MRFAPLSLFFVLAVFAAAEKGQRGPLVPKGGVKTPGVQIPFASLKADAEFPLETGALVFEGSKRGQPIWVSDTARNAIQELDPKTNQLTSAVVGLHGPCGTPVFAFGSLWSPACGNQTIERIDMKSSKIVAAIETGVSPVAQFGAAANADSVWILADAHTALLRIDPDRNLPVAEIALPAGCNNLLFGETALWAACPGVNRVLRIDPRTNLVVNRIETAAEPRSIAVGEGSVWVLCGAEGKVARIDPKTNQVAATIDLNIPRGGGNIAFGERSIWVSSGGFPITRIDPKTGKVVQQFYDPSAAQGGTVYVGSGSIWLWKAHGGLARFDPLRIAATLAE